MNILNLVSNAIDNARFNWQS